jgi:hypothetical protein
MPDRLFLAVAVTLSLLWYAPQLGFYSDDWAFLGRYATSPDQTLAGLYAASHSPQHASRPVQLWLCAAVYWLFGFNPAGHQLVTAVLVVANALLVLAIATALSVPRPIALSAALIYGTLPSYSTDRYWYLAVAITFSVTASLVSLYADIKAQTLPVRTGLWWKLLSATALVVSVLAYEVAVPVLLVAPPLIAWHLHRRDRHRRPRRVLYLTALVAINVVLLAGLSVFKLRTAVRLGAEQGIGAQVADIARHAVRRDVARSAYGLNLVNAARVHVQDYGVLLPVTAWRLARSAPAAVIVLTLLAGVGTLAYCLFTFDAERFPSAPVWQCVLLSGVAVFALGYAIFLTNYNVQFTTTGIANRTAIVAALGAAMSITGGLGLVAGILPSMRARTRVFAALLAVYTASGVASVNAVAGYWIEAYVVERDVLAGIRERLPTMPPESALILDGVCPYLGPAIVFEADWDLAGALQVMYGDATLAANVVTPRVRIEEDALSFTLYDETTRYLYSSLLVYDARTGAVERIPNREAAEAYFARLRGAWSCPPGHEGIGVEVF